jgi:hypothetical protein
MVKLRDLGLREDDFRALARGAHYQLTKRGAFQPRVTVGELQSAETLAGLLGILYSHATNDRIPQSELTAWLREILEEIFPPPPTGAPGGGRGGKKSGSSQPKKRTNK